MADTDPQWRFFGDRAERQMRQRGLQFILVSLLGLSMVGCNSVPLRQDLTQDQANEIVAVLHHHGISAEVVRESGGRGVYRVDTKREAYSQAVALLYDKGLPAEPRQSFDELTASHGLIPNSREVEALRLDRARASEIEQAVMGNPAISSARVIVRTAHEFGNQSGSAIAAHAGSSEAAGASVIIVRRPGKTVTESDIRDIVQRVVPGIQRESIDVKTYDAEPSEDAEAIGVVNKQGLVQRIPLTSFLGAWRVPEDDYNGLALTITIGIVLIFFIGFAVGWGGFLFRSVSPPTSGPLNQEYFSEKLVLPRGATRGGREASSRRGASGGGG